MGMVRLMSTIYIYIYIHYVMVVKNYNSIAMILRIMR